MRRVSWQRLSTQVVIMQVAILVITMVAGFAIFQWNLKRQLYGQYEQRSLMLAQTLASQPSIMDAVVAWAARRAGPEPGHGGTAPDGRLVRRHHECRGNPVFAPASVDDWPAGPGRPGTARQ